MDEVLFWYEWPQMLPLYETLIGVMTRRYPDMQVKASKTRISFYRKHMFVMVK